MAKKKTGRKRPMLSCTSYAVIDGEYQPICTTWQDGRCEYHVPDEVRIPLIQAIFDRACREEAEEVTGLYGHFDKLY